MSSLPGFSMVYLPPQEEQPLEIVLEYNSETREYFHDTGHGVYVNYTYDPVEGLTMIGADNFIDSYNLSKNTLFVIQYNGESLKVPQKKIGNSSDSILMRMPIIPRSVEYIGEFVWSTDSIEEETYDIGIMRMHLDNCLIDEEHTWDTQFDGCVGTLYMNFPTYSILEPEIIMVDGLTRKIRNSDVTVLIEND